MFSTVHGILADEGGHRYPQFGRLDVIAIMADGMYEIALAVRKEQRQGVGERVTCGPNACQLCAWSGSSLSRRAHLIGSMRITLPPGLACDRYAIKMLKDAFLEKCVKARIKKATGRKASRQ